MHRPYPTKRTSLAAAAFLCAAAFGMARDGSASASRATTAAPHESAPSETLSLRKIASNAKRISTDKFFATEQFHRGVLDAASDFVADGRALKGGVVPHHYVGSRYVADLFLRLQAQQPRRIILIGPNHDELGDAPALTTSADFSTPFGNVLADRSTIAALAASGAATYNDAVLATDHSVAGLMPFVARYLPDATVVPVLLKKRASEDMLAALTIALSDIATASDTVIIGSIDFSHYLPTTEADMRDEETLAALRGREHVTIAAMEPSHMDSPSTWLLVRALMDSSGIGDFKVLGQGNSGRILDAMHDPSTSYFELGFYK